MNNLTTFLPKKRENLESDCKKSKTTYKVQIFYAINLNISCFLTIKKDLALYGAKSFPKLFKYAQIISFSVKIFNFTKRNILQNYFQSLLGNLSWIPRNFLRVCRIRHITAQHKKPI
jgi:hypothetical protein